MRLKVAIIRFLLRHAHFILVADFPDLEEHRGMVLTTLEGSQYLEAIILSCLENKPEMRSIFLNSAEKYLSRYEVDGKNFASRILSK